MDPTLPQLPQLPQRSARTDEVVFEGDHLVVVHLEGEGLAVPVREICQALGLDVDTQAAQIRDHEVLSRGLRMVRVRYGDRMRSLTAILHKYIPFWMATISPGLVGEAVRPKLIRYQLELVEVLAALYGGNLAPVTPTDPDSPTAALQQQFLTALQEVRLAREALVAAQERFLTDVQRQETRLTSVEQIVDSQLTTLGGQIARLESQIAGHTTITGPQQETLKRAIQRIAARYQQKTGQKIYDRLFSQFCMDLGTPRYDGLPAGRYPDALDWLRRQAAHYLPDDPDALPPLQEGLL
jgi:hypothetical protein